jgi:hypothetical protein
MPKDALSMSEQLPCRAVGLARSTFDGRRWRRPPADPDADLRAWLRLYDSTEPQKLSSGKLRMNKPPSQSGRAQEFTAFEQYSADFEQSGRIGAVDGTHCGSNGQVE